MPERMEQVMQKEIPWLAVLVFTLAATAAVATPIAIIWIIAHFVVKHW